DDVALGPVVAPEGQRAQFDDKEEHRLTRGRGGLARGAGETDDAAGAAEPEDRQPSCRTGEPHPLDQQRIKARRRDPCGRYDDNAADLVLAEAGQPERLDGRLLEEIERGGDIDAISLRPAVLMVVPFD